MGDHRTDAVLKKYQCGYTETNEMLAEELRVLMEKVA